MKEVLLRREKNCPLFAFRVFAFRSQVRPSCKHIDVRTTEKSRSTETKTEVQPMHFQRVTTQRDASTCIAAKRTLSSGVVKAYVNARARARAYTERIVSRSFQIQRARITYFLLSPSAVERNRIIAAGKINTRGEAPSDRRERVLRMS